MASEKKRVVRRTKASTSDTPVSQPTTTGAASTKVAAATPTKVTAKSAQVVTPTTAKAASGKPSTNKTPARKTKRSQKAGKPFILFRPFINLAHYFRDSWRELRKVEWPSRRATWKMTLAVIIFCAVVGLIVLVCDWAFQWLIQEVIL